MKLIPQDLDALIKASFTVLASHNSGVIMYSLQRFKGLF